MKKVLIFGGTSEGRTLAKYLLSQNMDTHISVATDYGEEVLTPLLKAKIHKGRLTSNEMETLIQRENFQYVVDATHPHAVIASEEIKKACNHLNMEYLRLLREDSSVNYTGPPPFFVNCPEEAREWLNQGTGNILLTTGTKDLQTIMDLIQDKSRVYARCLANQTSILKCLDSGISGSRVIGMQGPFSEELNYAMLRQIEAKYLVTKETGIFGGYDEKINACNRAGVKVCVIKRPIENGYSFSQMIEKMNLPKVKILKEKKQREIILLGLGMGSVKGMTMEGYQSCENADVIIGSKRLLKSVCGFHKPLYNSYKSDEIFDYLEQHKEYQKVVIVLSGDVGFYSGAKKIIEHKQIQEKQFKLKLLCGISSIAYFASKLNLSWDDAKLLSNHGKEDDVIMALRENEKVFVLMDDSSGVRKLSKSLIEFNMEDSFMFVGNQLSYDEETVLRGTPFDFINYENKGLSVVMLLNPLAKERTLTHGMADDLFIRGKAPMTKEEIRSISISKMGLTKKAIVYDIGAGTGAVSVECARLGVKHVYAVECQEEAHQLLNLNKKNHLIHNMTVIKGKAPEAFRSLPAPTHAFIGGSKKMMNQIIEGLLNKNKDIKIVINAITIETVMETMEVIKKYELQNVDVVQAFISKSKSISGYHMMMGQNPVYIITINGAKT